MSAEKKWMQTVTENENLAVEVMKYDVWPAWDDRLVCMSHQNPTHPDLLHTDYQKEITTRVEEPKQGVLAFSFYFYLHNKNRTYFCYRRNYWELIIYRGLPLLGEVWKDSKTFVNETLYLINSMDNWNSAFIVDSNSSPKTFPFWKDNLFIFQFIFWH